MFFWGGKSKNKDAAAFASTVNILKIKEQVEKQLQILNKIGILETFPEGKIQGILGIDNKVYSAPSVEEVIKRIESKKELLKEKVRQGFIKIILVPFACPLEKIIKKYEEIITVHYNDGKLLVTKEKPSEADENLELDISHPINVWNEFKDGDVKNNFIYFPKTFEEKNHQGKTKLELLSEPENAWQIFLIENMPNIPLEGVGKTVGHRKQIEANKTPTQYLEMLRDNKAYRGEEGLTLEADLIYAITHLEETNQIINDWQGKGNISCEFGSFFVSSSIVPCLSWDRDFNRANLWKLNISKQDQRTGARTGIKF